MKKGKGKSQLNIAQDTWVLVFGGAYFCILHFTFCVLPLA